MESLIVNIKKEYESPNADIEKFVIDDHVLTTSSLDNVDDDDDF